MRSRRAIPIVTTVDEQLRRWVSGESTHLQASSSGPLTCCPDFSCCRPSLKRSQEERERFANASETERHFMLLRFLQALCDSTGRKVRVIE